MGETALFEDTATVKTINMTEARQKQQQNQQGKQKDRIGPLTLSPTQSLDEAKFLESSIQTNNDQAKLWPRQCSHDELVAFLMP